MTTRQFVLRLSLLPLALLCVGCAEDGTPTPKTVAVLRRMQPETMSLGVTAPNLFSGPVQTSKSNNPSRRDSVGQLGATVTFTWRLSPIRVERQEVQPVQIVRPTPTAPATPVPHARPTPTP